MHPLHDYVAKQLAEKLKTAEGRRLVRRAPRVRAVHRRGARRRRGPRASPCPSRSAASSARLAEYDGSMFELRAVVEPHVSGDAPECVVIYLPGASATAALRC